MNYSFYHLFDNSFIFFFQPLALGHSERVNRGVLLWLVWVLPKAARPVFDTGDANVVLFFLPRGYFIVCLQYPQDEVSYHLLSPF